MTFDSGKKAAAIVAGTLALFGVLTPRPCAAEDWNFKGYFDQDNRYRGNDIGLSKQRNTIRFDGEKVFDGDLGPFHDTSIVFKLRGTYDSVYELNSEHYGKDAGGSICLQSTANNTCQPHGRGAFGRNPDPSLPLSGQVPNFAQLGFDISKNPNEGLIALGEPLHGQNGGVSFGVPVRPCDVDRRGCLPGYLDADRDELRFSDFNDRYDWLREAYVSSIVDINDSQSLFFRLGRQQVVWGRTDLFRILDVVNPVDYSRNNIYDELQDIRIPMWMLTGEYRMGPVSVFQDLNMQLVWNFDKFRPDPIGQCGTANVIIDAGCFFRGAKNLWDNGGTVANFAPNPPVLSGPENGLMATDFGPHQIGIRQVNLPSQSLSNSQIGLKTEGVVGPVSFSLNALYYRSQLPSLHGGTEGPAAVSPFGGLPGYSTQPQQYPYLIAFDVNFPRVLMAGGSMDFTIPQIKTAMSFEGAMTWGEEFPNTARESLYSKSRTARYVIRADRLTFIKFLNPNRTFIISGQIFGEHLLDHELEHRKYGDVGIPNWKNNWIATLLVWGFYDSDRIQPQVIAAHDFKANANALQPSLIWLLSDKLRLQVGANIKFGESTQPFDDARSTNPYPPYTTYNGDLAAQPGSLGLSGSEPLGRFRSGPLGMSAKEDEAFVTFSYQFF